MGQQKLKTNSCFLEKDNLYKMLNFVQYKEGM
jgi:hypothetical protein